MTDRETRPEPNPLRGSRTSGLWFAVVGSAIVLVLLIVFIAQNTDPVGVCSSAGRERLPWRWHY